MPLPCLIGLEGPDLTGEEESAIQRFQPAGFVLFSRNIKTAGQTRLLTDRLRSLCLHAPVIAIDQEGGRVVRTSSLGLELPSARTMRAPEAKGDIPAMGHLIAASLKLLGINTDFAPVLDICHDEKVANALPGRCWGTDSQQVISCAGVFGYSLAGEGVAGCGKHFPGMGWAASDPHQDLPVLDASLEDLLVSDLIPFLTLSPDLPSIMVAHLLIPGIDPEWPASLSRRAVTDILRNQIGYKGLVFTDDLCMGAISNKFGIAEAATLSLKAGWDFPLICHDSLAHLDDFARLAPEWQGYEKKVRGKRLQRFFKHLSQPIPFTAERWNEILEETRDFVARHPDHLQPAPRSAVQEY